MSSFNYTRYMPVTSDGDQRDVFNSQFRNMRFAVPVKEQIILGGAFSYNAPGLAKAYLGDERLWWTIIHFNGFKDPRIDMYPGRLVRIPDRQALLNLLETASNSTTQVRL